MRVVLDTNVLVSGLLSPFGPPAEIVRLVAVGKLKLCYDARILAEYREVLARPRFGFDSGKVDDLLEQISSEGELVTATPLSRHLPDPDDEPFLEVACGTAAECLVTGNLKHFPVRRRQGMTVLSPREFVDHYQP
ncbi:MAG: putative toxin-antitoxin system toxin component, PIN family [Planctomycetota bacterium]|jgi:putative PIN family toxin of toxin-antitoxin system|nr:putative toxin-antitoxin system toxin component, PIN family [Planctomycetota bacterium]MDP7131645.1 putative toxin-antitoxin system toxin component, PIN family [Planctomycetota bacterium]MDP7251557.1 putative toxin-antitoxin system toxin component, PIN family [Planctomycetota bacterium]